MSVRSTSFVHFSAGKQYLAVHHSGVAAAKSNQTSVERRRNGLHCSARVPNIVQEVGGNIQGDGRRKFLGHFKLHFGPQISESLRVTVDLYS